MFLQVKEEEKENRQLKEENLLMTNKTETLKVSESKINQENLNFQNISDTEFWHRKVLYTPPHPNSIFISMSPSMYE